jgi:hypothetical protein
MAGGILSTAARGAARAGARENRAEGPLLFGMIGGLGGDLRERLERGLSDAHFGERERHVGRGVQGLDVHGDGGVAEHGDDGGHIDPAAVGDDQDVRPQLQIVAQDPCLKGVEGGEELRVVGLHGRNIDGIPNESKTI